MTMWTHIYGKSKKEETNTKPLEWFFFKINFLNKDLPHMVLKELPKEYNALCFVIHSRSEHLLFDKLHPLL